MGCSSVGRGVELQGSTRLKKNDLREIPCTFSGQDVYLLFLTFHGVPFLLPQSVHPSITLNIISPPVPRCNKNRKERNYPINSQVYFQGRESLLSVWGLSRLIFATVFYFFTLILFIFVGTVANISAMSQFRMRWRVKRETNMGGGGGG